MISERERETYEDFEEDKTGMRWRSEIPFRRGYRRDETRGGGEATPAVVSLAIALGPAPTGTRSGARAYSNAAAAEVDA
jgi:hypothetical protein